MNNPHDTAVASCSILNNTVPNLVRDLLHVLDRHVPKLTVAAAEDMTNQGGNLRVSADMYKDALKTLEPLRKMTQIAMSPPFTPTFNMIDPVGDVMRLKLRGHSVDDIAKQLGLTAAEVAAHTATALDSYVGDREAMFGSPPPTQPKKVRLSAVLPMLRDAAGRAITHRIFDQLPEARLRECSPPGTGLLLREVLDIEPEAVVKVKEAEWFIGTASDGVMCKLDAKVIPHVHQLASELTAERAEQAADLNEIVEAAEAAPRAYLSE